MNREQYLAHFDADSERFAVVTADHLETGIEFLGDWTVRDLVAHLGAVYAFCRANLLAQTDEVTFPSDDEARAPEGDAVMAWFRERRDAVREALEQADLDAVGWTFAGMEPGSFWVRRMAHETSVHRWDAEAAVGDFTPVDPALASDGIDEYTDVGLRSSSSRPDRVYPEQTVHLHCTDVEGEWMLARGADGAPVVTREHGKGDAAVRGTAADLLLWVWGRPMPADRLEIFGDQSVADAWRDLAP